MGDMAAGNALSGSINFSINNRKQCTHNKTLQLNKGERKQNEGNKKEGTLWLQYTIIV